MPRGNRNGRRTRRNEFEKRKLRLGYYYIITDTEETEKNYFDGLRRSIPQELSGHIKINVEEGVKTKDLIQVCLNESNTLPQYAERWIVLDRDEVPNFDSLIYDAGRKGIYVAWSNPCFEVWMDAYFENMHTFTSSAACTKHFGETYKKKIGHEYNKNEKEIYAQLIKYGNEEVAISRAKKKLAEHERNGITNISEMCPGSSVFELVVEIKTKINS